MRSVVSSCALGKLENDPLLPIFAGELGLRGVYALGPASNGQEKSESLN
jgi:hypothetical protein